MTAIERTIEPKVIERNLHPYTAETRRPLVSLVFVAPLLLLYEFGIVVLGDEATRNGLDEMFRFQTYYLGLGEMIILPLITVAILLGWHHWIKDRWKIRVGVLLGMILESICLGLILLMAAKALQILMNNFSGSEIQMSLNKVYTVQWWSNTVAFLGAGVYEELVFRLLILLPLICVTAKVLKRRLLVAVIMVVATSVLFALLHYQVLNPSGLPFDWPSFSIRFLASVFFCVVFLARGFGLAVGTHIVYDIMTQF